jgi:hypothetical protein
MGDVIKFRARLSVQLDPEVQWLVKSTFRGTEREAMRRRVVYGADAPAEIERLIGLYPMFRLTHAKRSRRCLYCNRKIEPLELHHVHDGSHVCQSGTCMGASPS